MPSRRAVRTSSRTPHLSYAGPMWRIRPVWAEGELRYLVHPPEVTHYRPLATG